jgi:transposase
MEDVLDVYHRPYDAKRPLICMDETNKQQLKSTQDDLALEPGKPLRYDSEYIRNGTSNIFLSVEPLTGKRKLQVTDTRKREDWALFIKSLVDEEYKEADKIVLVMDNLNTHAGASLYKTFAPAEAKRLLDKLDIHYTPKHGSWLNMAELELSHLSRQCLARRIADQPTLIQEVDAWTKARNEKHVTIDWQFTTTDARIKLKKLYPELI